MTIGSKGIICVMCFSAVKIVSPKSHQTQDFCSVHKKPTRSLIQPTLNRDPPLLKQRFDDLFTKALNAHSTSVMLGGGFDQSLLIFGETHNI